MYSVFATCKNSKGIFSSPYGGHTSNALIYVSLHYLDPVNSLGMMVVETASS